MKKKKTSPTASSFYKNRMTILSLLVILIMFALIKIFYAEGVPQTQVGKGEVGVGQPAIGGSFELQDENGHPFTQENLKGKYQLITFGFTFCPDVCPTNLSRMANVHESLPTPMQDALGMVLVTVDPERDTPDVLKNYTDAFHEKIIGLTGTMEQVKDVGKKYLVYFAKNGEGETYLVDHSSYIYFIGPEGDYITHFRFHATEDEILSKIKKYLHQ